MPAISIKFREEDMRAVLESMASLSAAMSRRVIGRATSTTLRDTRSFAVRRVRGEFPKLKRSAISSRIKVERGRLSGAILLRTAPIALSQFGARRVGPRRGRRGRPSPRAGVQVTVRSTQFLPSRDGYFMQSPKPGQALQVYRRLTARRYPIAIQRGPSILEALGGSDGRAVQDFAATKLIAELARQVDLALAR